MQKVIFIRKEVTMLRPSYTDLLEEINKGAEGEDVVGSRYTIVIAAAKRARQLIDHAEPLTDKIDVDRPVSIAVHELYEGKKTVVKGAKDEDGKGDSTIFGNAEAVDAILMEMEDIHEWNEEATESIIKRLSSHLVPDFFTLGKKTPGATIDEIRAVQSWLEDGTEEKVVISRKRSLQE